MQNLLIMNQYLGSARSGPYRHPHEIKPSHPALESRKFWRLPLPPDQSLRQASKSLRNSLPQSKPIFPSHQPDRDAGCVQRCIQTIHGYKQYIKTYTNAPVLRVASPNVIVITKYQIQRAANQPNTQLRLCSVRCAHCHRSFLGISAVGLVGRSLSLHCPGSVPSLPSASNSAHLIGILADTRRHRVYIRTGRRSFRFSSSPPSWLLLNSLQETLMMPPVVSTPFMTRWCLVLLWFTTEF
jgi:hypothetical protein